MSPPTGKNEEEKPAGDKQHKGSGTQSGECSNSTSRDSVRHHSTKTNLSQSDEGMQSGGGHSDGHHSTKAKLSLSEQQQVPALDQGFSVYFNVKWNTEKGQSNAGSSVDPSLATVRVAVYYGSKEQYAKLTVSVPAESEQEANKLACSYAAKLAQEAFSYAVKLAEDLKEKEAVKLAKDLKEKGAVKLAEDSKGKGATFRTDVGLSDSELENELKQFFKFNELIKIEKIDKEEKTEARMLSNMLK